MRPNSALDSGRSAPPVFSVVARKQDAANHRAIVKLVYITGKYLIRGYLIVMALKTAFSSPDTYKVHFYAPKT